MGFWERMKEAVDKGIETSRDVLGKAADKAKELGEKGVLKFEIMQLENQAQKKFAQLGAAVFEQLVKQGAESVSGETEGIKALIEELVKIEKKTDEKEEALKKI